MRNVDHNWRILKIKKIIHELLLCRRRKFKKKKSLASSTSDEGHLFQMYRL